MATHKEIVNPLFREVPRRVVRKKSRRGRPGADDESSSEDDTHASGFGVFEDRPLSPPPNLPALATLRQVPMSRRWKRTRHTSWPSSVSSRGWATAYQLRTMYSSPAELETPAHLEELLRDAIPSDPDVPSYPNVHEVEERLAEIERRRAERCVYRVSLSTIDHCSLCNPAAIHAGRSVASRYVAAAKAGQLREHSARSLP